MVQPVPIFTPVETENTLSRLPALYLSPLFCNREVAVFNRTYLNGNQICDRKNYNTTFTATALKIATYILSAGILPLLAIVLNLAIRATTDYNYAVQESSLPTETDANETYDGRAARIIRREDPQPEPTARETEVLELMAWDREVLQAVLDDEANEERRSIILEAIARRGDDDLLDEFPVLIAPGGDPRQPDPEPNREWMLPDADLIQLADEKGYYSLTTAQLREELQQESNKCDELRDADQIGLSDQHFNNMRALEKLIADRGEEFHPEAPPVQSPPPTSPMNEPEATVPVQLPPLPPLEDMRKARLERLTKLTTSEPVEIPAATPSPRPATPPALTLSPKGESERKKELKAKVLETATSTIPDRLVTPLDEVPPPLSSPTQNNSLGARPAQSDGIDAGNADRLATPLEDVSSPPSSPIQNNSLGARPAQSDGIDAGNAASREESEEFLKQMRETVKKSKNITPPSSPPKISPVSPEPAPPEALPKQNNALMAQLFLEAQQRKAAAARREE
ncbi:MAG TPA: hypothetical protein VHL30_04720 [Chlamydiales bacterium]|nr:hypothetical protein [Chlamydiales bacterium]